nr:ubiquitin-NEDD8-like protein RUB1 [Nicotiana tomentosiformis]XP_033515658.1 ubiquitin-NEDD8-like protein RUB1 [Nicotiana tomentosiformis]XP_033515659.1 ubiquitin-NEDD8-like protein RUB1 [Nicotiana tomentosiformis]
MPIIIQDDTYRDVSNWRSLPKNFLPKFGVEDVINVSGHSESKTFLLMVESDESIAAIKAYIQEEKGISFKKQKLLNEEGGVLRDTQTLLSVGIKKGSILVLRYALITQISVKTPTGHTIKVMVESDDTIADVKAAIQEKEGFRFHKQLIFFDGKRLADHQRLGIKNDDVLDHLLHICGC